MTDQVVTLWRCTVCGKTEPNSGQSARYCGQTKACTKKRRGGRYDLAPMERVEYVPATAAVLQRQALAELVRLKDGPRDDAYRNAKDAAWQAARDALALDETDARKDAP